MDAPAAPLWPPPPKRTVTAVASQPGTARTDSFVSPSTVSRRVAAMRTPATVRGKLEMLSISSSLTPISSSTARGIAQMAISPPRSSSRCSTIHACIFRRSSVFVSNSS